jgi:hypothetical protein
MIQILGLLGSGLMVDGILLIHRELHGQLTQRMRASGAIGILKTLMVKKALGLKTKENHGQGRKNQLSHHNVIMTLVGMLRPGCHQLQRLLEIKAQLAMILKAPAL